MNNERIHQLSEELYHCLTHQTTVAPLTERYPEISIDDAYHISLGFVQRRLDAGEVMTGKKIGVTSKAVQDMLGVFQPDFGFLTDRMQCQGEIAIAGQLIQPRAEAEIAFCLKKDLQGPGVTEAQVLDAIDYIAPCFEIVDSRIQDWRINIQDTIADNASCGVFVIGPEKLSPRGVDLPNLKAVVQKNGEFLSEGLGSAVQGNPLTAAAWLANTLGRYGIPFKAGELILTGSLVPLEPVVAGDALTLHIEGLGGAAVQFV